jgi:hypothetical protein
MFVETFLNNLRITNCSPVANELQQVKVTCFSLHIPGEVVTKPQNKIHIKELPS